MKLYRNRRFTDRDSCGGFVWFVTKNAAEYDAKVNPEDYTGVSAVVAQTMSVPCTGPSVTKTNMAAFLNDHASHPDNG